jgi:hypothetical protein
MKKAFVFILAIFYLAVASGVTVNMHYCMGDLTSVNYGHGKEEGGKCGKCGMPDDNNACCHTDSKLVKLQDDHQLSSLAFKSKQPDAFQVFQPTYAPAITNFSQSFTSGPIHSPPDNPHYTIYVYNCVFRI